MSKQPNKTHVFITLENLVKIFRYKNMPIKLNRVWYEDQIESMEEAGVSPSDSNEVVDRPITQIDLDSENITEGNLDSESSLEDELEDESSQTTKPSGAVSFLRKG